VTLFSRGAAICAALFSFLATPSLSEPVTVTSPSGGLSVTGEVLGFDGTYLRLESAFGPVTVDFTNMSCAGARCPDPTRYVPTLRLEGAERLSGVLFPALAEGYAHAQGMIAERSATGDDSFAYVIKDDGVNVLRLEITVGTSDSGFAAQAAGQTDLALSLRTATVDEAAPSRLRVLALEALTPVVSPARGLSSISLADLARVMAGEITDWADLGGEAGPIEVIAADADPSFSAALDQAVLSPLDLARTDDVALYHSYADVAAAVSSNDAAIAVLPIGALGNTKALTLAETCGLRSRPQLSSIKAEDYPLTFPLYYYLPDRRLPPRALGFLAWLNTAEAQLVIRRTGLVDLGAVAIPVEAQGERLAAAIAHAGREVGLDELQRMVRFFAGRDRLSSTFRFEPGAATLDAPSRSHLQSIAAALRSGRYKGHQLTLVGFSDADGPAAANRDLSRARADSVRSALLRLLGGEAPDGIVIDTEAFGEAMPMGCDDTVWGRQINRRVEHWVSQ